MLEDMWDSRGIWWIGLEANREDIVRVISGNVQILCARLIVVKLQSRQLKLWKVLGPLQRKSVKLFAWLGILAELRHRRIPT